MSKCTPGDWYVAAPFYVKSDHEGLIEGTHTIVCRATNLDDARLLASAPEMLAVLEGLAEGPLSLNELNELMADAREVIAKAKGEKE